MSKRNEVGYNDPKGIIINKPAIGGLFAAGTTVPADATTGYAPGCIFLDTDASAGAQLWINQGTAASCLFRRLDAGYAGRLVASGASLTITQALHDGKTIVLAAAAAITLPAFTGSGARYRFVQGATATAVTITATGAYLYGSLVVNTDSAFQAGTLFTSGAAVSAGSTTITFDGSTKGGNIGDWIEIEDIATNKGAVKGVLNASGTEATPYS